MAFFDDVMVEQIGRESRQIQFSAVLGRAGRLILAAIGWLLFGAGWIVRKTFIVLWRAVTWSVTAVRLGWQAAGEKPPPKH